MALIARRTPIRRAPRIAALLGALAIAAGLAGCASTPQEIPALQSAQAAYQQANSQPRIDDVARRAMQQAERNLQRAQSLVDEGADREEVEHYAFLAHRHVEIAQARLQRALNQDEIASADQRRQELLLAAEKREAARSQAQATVAQQRAQQAEQRLESTREELEQTREAARTLAQELDDLKVKQDERGTVLTLSDVVFDLNSAELNEGGARSVTRIANTLKKYPEGRIRVEGYTDSTGSEAYNADLSERRAKSVKQIFVNNGIPAERLIVEGYGEQYPVASNDTPQGRQLNRRVEIVVGSGDGQQPQGRDS